MNGFKKKQLQKYKDEQLTGNDSTKPDGWPNWFSTSPPTIDHPQSGIELNI